MDERKFIETENDAAFEKIKNLAKTNATISNPVLYSAGDSGKFLEDTINDKTIPEKLKILAVKYKQNKNFA